MTLNDWLTILAIVLAPLIALRVGGALDRRKEARDRKQYIFRTLMTTRARRLDPYHVQALNMIDIEFDSNSKKDKAVRRAWKAYLDLLNNSSLTGQAWFSKKEDTFLDLMHKMGISLGYDFSKTDIKNTSYFPRGHGESEDDQRIIREKMKEVLSGERVLPVGIIDYTYDDDNDPDDNADEEEVLPKLVENE